MEDSYNKSISSARKNLLSILEKKLSPLAMQYNYCKNPLENNIKWKPIVLILGNYSSGKSTLINETLYPILNKHFFRGEKEPLPYDSVS